MSKTTNLLNFLKNNQIHKIFQKWPFLQIFPKTVNFSKKLQKFSKFTKSSKIAKFYQIFQIAAKKTCLGPSNLFLFLLTLKSDKNVIFTKIKFDKIFGSILFTK